MDEHQFLAIARGEGKEEIGRTAVHTKSYADACGEVGTQQKVAVLDLWSVMIKAAGWDGGPTLPGSLAAEPNETLKEYLGDGTSLLRVEIRKVFVADMMQDFTSFLLGIVCCTML